MATIVAQVLLFLVMTYFTVFTHEAVTLEGFPAAGTLFGAFSISRWSRIVFFLALWTPFMACCAVLITSRKPPLAIGIIPIALVTLSSQRTLERATFFGRLTPLSFIEGRFKSRWLRTPPLKGAPKPQADARPY